MDFNFMVCKVAHRLRRNWPALPADGVLQMESVSSCLGSTQSTSTAVRGSTPEWGLYATGLQSVLRQAEAEAWAFSLQGDQFISSGLWEKRAAPRGRPCCRTPRCCALNASGQCSLLGPKPSVWLEHMTSITDFRGCIALPPLLPGYQCGGTQSALVPSLLHIPS